MGLDAAFGIATGGLANVSLGLSVVSQNVANSGTPGYAREAATQTSLDGGGVPGGVRSGPVVLASDPPLQAQALSLAGDAASAQTRAGALSAIDPVLGKVGSSDDLGSLLTQLQGGFSALLNDPSSTAQQASVVADAQTLAQGINSLAAAYGGARQSAQDDLVAAVSDLNTALGQIGSLSRQIMSLKAAGASTADLENQRNAAMQTVAGLVDAHFVTQPDGNLMVLTRAGAQLPTSGGAPLSITGASTGAAAYYPGGGLPGIMLGGQDISAAMKGGRIGADLTLRDQTMPLALGELDEFSESLATRFDAQGLRLFTDPAGQVPAATGTPTQAGYLGFSSSITVNPAVLANPALVRDGTQAIAGSATGASAFTPNPNGEAGFTTLIDRVLNFTFGSEVQPGVSQTPPAVSGLGASGTLDAPFAAETTLLGYANAFTASQSATSAAATQQASSSAALQTSVSNKLAGSTGVDMDTEMSTMVQLQNAYGVNAKIVGAVQTMWNQLLGMVQ
jgi:flagellar hook-associated protein 1 FlgK